MKYNKEKQVQQQKTLEKNVKSERTSSSSILTKLPVTEKVYMKTKK